MPLQTRRYRSTAPQDAAAMLRWDALYRDTCAKLTDAIAIANTSTGHPVSDGILAPLAKRLQRALNQIAHDDDSVGAIPDYFIGKWGANGRGPAIDDMIRSVNFHARTARRAADFVRAPEPVS